MGFGYENKCIVVDLDGTLVKGNTLHMLILWMLFRVPVSDHMRLACCLFRRLVRMDTHVRMKGHVLDIAVNSLTNSQIERFVDTLRTHINKEVMMLIEDFRSRNGHVVVATAAPDIYARPLVAALGLDKCISSDTDEVIDSGVETRNEQKKNEVLSYAASKGLMIDTVVTDHHDDLPLLMVPEVRRVLVNPSAGLCHMLDARALPYEVIKF